NLTTEAMVSKTVAEVKGAFPKDAHHLLTAPFASFRQVVLGEPWARGSFEQDVSALLRDSWIGPPTQKEALGLVSTHFGRKKPKAAKKAAPPGEPCTDVPTRTAH